MFGGLRYINNKRVTFVNSSRTILFLTPNALISNNQYAIYCFSKRIFYYNSRK